MCIISDIKCICAYVYVYNSASVFSNVGKFLQIFPFYRVQIELLDAENLCLG